MHQGPIALRAHHLVVLGVTRLRARAIGRERKTGADGTLAFVPASGCVFTCPKSMRKSSASRGRRDDATTGSAEEVTPGPEARRALPGRSGGARFHHSGEKTLPNRAYMGASIIVMV